MKTDAPLARRRPAWARHLLAVALVATTAPALAQQGEGEQMRHDEPAAPGPADALRFTPRIAAAVTFTDNLYGLPGDAADGDAYFDLAPGLNLRAVRPRYRAYLDYQADLVKYVEHDEEDTVFHSLAHAGTAELVEDYVYLDTHGYIARQLIDPSVSYTSNEPFAVGNATSVASYGISPYLLNRFGSWADSELRYGFRHVIPFDDSRATALSHQVLAEVTSGARFVHTRWNLQVEGQHVDYSSDDAAIDRVAERARAELDGAYDVNRFLTLLASVGAEHYDDPTYGESIGEPIGSAGLTVRPGPLSSITVRYRHRYERDFWIGEAAWQPSPLLYFAASHDETVSTSQELLASTLGQIGVDDGGDLVDVTDPPRQRDEFGQLINPLTYYGLDLTEDTFGLIDRAFNRRMSQLRATWSPGRNRVHGLLFREERWSDVFNYDQTTYGVSGQWARQLAPDLHGTVEARYRWIDWESLGGRQDNIYNAGLELDYRLGPGTTAYAEYQATYVDREDIDNITENVVTVGIRKTF